MNVLRSSLHIVRGALLGGLLIASSTASAVIIGSNTTAAILDGASAVRDINISGTGATVANISIDVDFSKCNNLVNGAGCIDDDNTLTTPWDISFTLTHLDSGTSATLVNFFDWTEAPSDNFSGILTFSDLGTDIAGSTTSPNFPLVGVWLANEPDSLATIFGGLDADATWRLTAVDNQTNGSTLVFHSVTLNIEEQAVASVPAPLPLGAMGLGLLGIGYLRKRRTSN
ncbi:MAG: hypothetical protein ACPG4N_01905 [Gammaproteobacteria bacterium]